MAPLTIDTERTQLGLKYSWMKLVHTLALHSSGLTCSTPARPTHQDTTPAGRVRGEVVRVKSRCGRSGKRGEDAAQLAAVAGVAWQRY